MFLFSILFCIPYWLKFRYTRELGLHETELGKNPLFNRIVHFWMYLPIAYFIPLIILIIANVYLIGTIMLARQRRQRLGMTGNNSTHNHRPSQQNNSQNQPMLLTSNNKNGGAGGSTTNTHRLSQEEKRMGSIRRRAGGGGGGGRGNNAGAGGMNITIMLIAVVCLFFCCQCPVLILHIMQSMFCTESAADRFRCQSSAFYQYAQVIAKFLLICNLSLNFACYCLFSQKFRAVLMETLPVFTCFFGRKLSSGSCEPHQAL